MLHQNLKTKSLPSSGPKLKVTNVSIQGVPQNTRAPRPRTHARARRNSILSAEKGQATAGGDAAHAAHVQKHGQRGGGMATACMTHPQSPAAPLSMREWHAAPFRPPDSRGPCHSFDGPRARRETASLTRPPPPRRPSSLACLTYLDRLRRPVRRCRSGGRSHEPRVSWKPAYTATYSAP